MTDAIDTGAYTRKGVVAWIREHGLAGSDLTGANLAGAILSWADLRDSILRGADLRGAKCYGANLAGANLRGADFTEAVLPDANPPGAGQDAMEGHCRAAARWAMVMTLEGTAFDRPVREAGGFDLDDAIEDCVRAASGDVGRAAGLGVAVGKRLLANYERGGVDRGAHFAGRYDGAE